MIYKLPPTTDQLLEDLKNALDDMGQEDKNAFIIDLIKFCLDWQFALMAFKTQEKTNGRL